VADSGANPPPSMGQPEKKPLTSPGHGESDIYRKSKHHFFLAGFYGQKM